MSEGRQTQLSEWAWSERAATWTEDATATNDVATATHAAVAGSSHYVTGLLASFDTVAIIGQVTLLDDVTTIATHNIHESGVVMFSRPLKITVGKDVSAALTSGGVGVVGNVTLIGYTSAS